MDPIWDLILFGAQELAQKLPDGKYNGEESGKFAGLGALELLITDWLKADYNY